MRRALGFKLESHGPRLMSFVRFCEDRDATAVTADLAVEWATSTASDHEAYQARRLDVVRIFARHLQPLDPATEVPPEDVLDRRQWRIPPYLYSPQEVTALMSAARTLRPAFRAVTWRTLIGLLAVTGMRQGEACRLRRDDVDLNAETIVIEDSKFGKSRMVFLHLTTAAALRAYCAGPRRGVPGGGGARLSRQQPRPAAGQPQHPQDVRRARDGSGHQGPCRAAGPAAARPEARLHGRDAAGLVSRRRGRPGPAPGPVQSGKHKTTGFNGQAIANLRGDLLFVSEPVTGHNHDMTALAETETADIIAAAYSGIGDKGYQGSEFITPFKKPQGGELLDWQKEFNTQVNKLRAPVERAIAHLKSWRILHTDYRRPLRTYVMSYRAAVGLYFFKLNFQ